LNKENNIVPDAASVRRKRVKRMKIWIISAALVLLILPTILCIILFIKMMYIQKQVDLLMIDRYHVTYREMNQQNKHNGALVYAAVPDDTEETEQTPASVTKESENNSKENNIDTVEENTIEENKNSLTVDEGSMSEDEKASSLDEGALPADKKPPTDKNSLSEEKNKSGKKKFLNKKVYLTFDDGPSCYTDEILDMLDQYHVKATFFVVGKTDEHSKEMYRRIVEEGHTLGMHSYSHKYEVIYKSVEDFDKDFTKLSDLLYDTTGYRPTIFRFPGGSSNSFTGSDIKDYIQYLNKKSITYYDWNVVSGDATGENLTPEELYKNVIDGIDMNTRSIVLMHDTAAKENTVKSLLHILQTLTKEGANIMPIDKNVAPIQQVKDELSEQK
jgi:Predicted xylanase/chitin deacetylase